MLKKRAVVEPVETTARFLLTKLNFLTNSVLYHPSMGRGSF